MGFANKYTQSKRKGPAETVIFKSHYFGVCPSVLLLVYLLVATLFSKSKKPKNQLKELEMVKVSTDGRGIVLKNKVISCSLIHL